MKDFIKLNITWDQLTWWFSWSWPLTCMYVCVCVCVCLCVCVCVCVCVCQLYNFGETVSLVFWTDTWRPESFYDKICKNRTAGLHTLCLLGETHTHTPHTPHTCTHRLSYVELTGCSSWTVCSGSSSLFRADHHQSSTHRHWGDPRDPEHTIQRGLNNLLVTDWVCVCVCVCACVCVCVSWLLIFNIGSKRINKNKDT